MWSCSKVVPAIPPWSESPLPTTLCERCWGPLSRQPLLMPIERLCLLLPRQLLRMPIEPLCLHLLRQPLRIAIETLRLHLLRHLWGTLRILGKLRELQQPQWRRRDCHSQVCRRWPRQHLLLRRRPPQRRHQLQFLPLRLHSPLLLHLSHRRSLQL